MKFTLLYIYITKARIAGNVKCLQSGQELVPHSEDFALFQTSNGAHILKFSWAFSAKLQGYLDKRYQLEQILAKYIVVWKDKETGEEFRVVLPEVRLCRNS